MLNRAGYAICFGLVGGMALCGWWRARYRLAASTPSPPRRRRLGKLCWRCRHLFPAAFLGLAALALLGGLLYAPCNFDALQYRLPRVFHWLAEGRWHWIMDAPLPRLNTRPCGMEWWTACLLALGRTDRLLFLANYIPFLLLPGMVFRVLTNLGVRGRVAWHWMWLLPSGYCFALQAGSIANDALGAAYALAAIDFALRARQSGRWQDVAISALAVGLMTGVKSSNLPLGLPWLVAIAPALWTQRRRWCLAAAVAVFALLVSFVPTALMNIRYSGEWSGAGLESGADQVQASFVKLIGNTLNLLVQNLFPPVFPPAIRWSQQAHQWLPAHFQEQLRAQFEPGGARLALPELQTEHMAGLGFGVAWLLVISVVAGCLWYRSAAPARSAARWGGEHPWVLWAAAVALLPYLFKLGLTTSARVIAPYYVFLVAGLLQLPGQGGVVRSRWWQALAATVLLLSAGLVMSTPMRPLFPTAGLLTKMQERLPHIGLLTKASTLYQTYQVRSQVLAPLREALPAGVTAVGLLSFGETPEASLWQPTLVPRVRHVLPDESGDALRQRGLEYVILGRDTEVLTDGLDFNEWVRRWMAARGGQVHTRLLIRVHPSKPPTPWYVVRLPPAGTS